MRLRYQVPAPIRQRYGPALNRNYQMIGRAGYSDALRRQQLMNSQLSNQRLALATKQARLRNLDMASQRHRDETAR
jgi:hypothetical protein